MKKREAFLVTAVSGSLCMEFSDFHKATEAELGRPVFTREMGSKEFWANLKEKVMPEFIALVRSLED